VSLERVFDTASMEQPVIANREMPARVPVRPQGHVEVIARLLLVAADGEQEVWVPAAAIRWTSTHVMVTWRWDPADERRSAICWLRATDVARCVRPRDPWPAGPLQPGKPGAD